MLDPLSLTADEINSIKPHLSNDQPYEAIHVLLTHCAAELPARLQNPAVYRLNCVIILDKFTKKPCIGIVLASHTGSTFENIVLQTNPGNVQQNAGATTPTIYNYLPVTPKEAAYLNQTCNIPFFNPYSQIPMDTALGFIFSALLAWFIEQADNIGDISMFPIYIIFTTMLLYPLLYSLMQRIASTWGGHTPFNFDWRTLGNIGKELGLILLFALSILGLYSYSYPMPDETGKALYLNQLGAAWAGGAGFVAALVSTNSLKGLRSLPRTTSEIKATAAEIAQMLLTFGLTFSALLDLKAFIEQAANVSPVNVAVPIDQIDTLKDKEQVVAIVNIVFTTLGLPVISLGSSLFAPQICKLLDYIFCCACRHNPRNKTGELKPLLASDA